MNWTKLEDFNPKQKKNDNHYMVICHDENKTIFGYERAELINGNLVVDSSVMNYYDQGFFISHYLKLLPPIFEFNIPVKVKELGDCVVGDFIVINKVIDNLNGHLWTLGKKYKVLKIHSGTDSDVGTPNEVIGWYKGNIGIRADNGKLRYLDIKSAGTFRYWTAV